jgi:hypothetical protein
MDKRMDHGRVEENLLVEENLKEGLESLLIMDYSSL